MPNTTIRAAAEGLPKITRRLFLRNTVAVGAAATVAVPAVAVEAQSRSPREEAFWHLRELERLTREDGAKRFVVMVVGNDYDDSSGAKCIQITEKGFFGESASKGMFASKGGEA